MTKKLTGSVMSYFLDFALVPGSEYSSVLAPYCVMMCWETLLNLFLRNYLPYNLYDKAERLRSKAPRFEAHSNQQSLLQAARKAPVATLGFRVQCVKWAILVRLLLVRIGDLELSNVQERFETFSVNMTHNLLVSISYSRISLTDVAQKLRLNSAHPMADLQNAFNSRIAFCLNMHNEAVRALRFPPNTHMEKESEEKSRER
ncbi:hypothetical protein Bca52824_057771 [Brassica carinata]|uniref:PCI domain-containing protein n=1 Tax=Brassica carinata TaxID=52824 RepID=A0A8X7QS75_BRACI|nr:hypothetical protein Bca52824_057771 [Brassica carinata]